MSASKKVAAAALAATIAAGAAVPVAQAATTTTTTTRTSVYHVAVNDGILAGGGDVVRVKSVVTNPEPSVRDWYSRSTIQKVVRKGVNNQYQKPYNSQGYRCVPVLDGSMSAVDRALHLHAPRRRRAHHRQGDIHRPVHADRRELRGRR